LIPFLRSRSLQRYVAVHGFGAALMHYGPKTTEAIELGVEIRDQGSIFRYDARLAFTSDDRLYFQTENAACFQPDGSGSISAPLGGGLRESKLQEANLEDKIIATVNWWLAGMTFYHFHDTSAQSKLRTHARREDDRYPRSDGSNLAAYLLRLKESDQDADRLFSRACSCA